MPPFGQPFLGSDSGGGSPPLLPPSDPQLLWQSYDVTNVSLVNGRQVELATDISTYGNDLTQSTSLNQPLSKEYDIVTQDTLANQPTLDYDLAVTQDTLASQPTLTDIGGGVLALQFDDDTYMDGQIFNSVTSTELECTLKIDIGNSFFFRDTTVGNTRIFLTAGGTSINLYLYGGSTVFVSWALGSDYRGIELDLKMTVSGDDVELFIDGASKGVKDLDGGTFNFNRLGSFTNQSINGYVKSLTYDGKTFLPDPTTMLKTDGTQPVAGDQVRSWRDASAELAMEFGNKGNMAPLPVPALDWSYRILIRMNTADYHTILTDAVDTGTTIQLRLGTLLWLTLQGGATLAYTFPSDVRGVKLDIFYTKIENSVNLWVNEVLVATYDITGFGPYVFRQLGKSNNNSISGELYSLLVWDTGLSSPVGITETPSFTLNATNDARTTAGAIAIPGDQIATWYADQHIKYENVIEMDVAKYLEGIPIPPNDFTLMVEYEDLAQATAGALISSDIDASAIFNVDADTTSLISGDSTNYDFDNVGGLNDFRQMTWAREGDLIYAYENSYLSPSAPLDVTGKVFNFTMLGALAGGKLMNVKQIALYYRHLIQDDINYPSYLRDSVTNEIQLDEFGEPQLPVPPVYPSILPTNGLNLTGDASKYLLADNELLVSATAFQICGWIKPVSVAVNGSIYCEITTTGGFRILFRHLADKIQVWATATGGQDIKSLGVIDGNLVAGQWNFISGSYQNESNVRVGMNGIYTYNNAYLGLDRPVSSVIGAHPPSIGLRKDATYSIDPFDGGLQFLRISNTHQLSESELESIRNAGTPDTTPCYDSIDPATQAKFASSWTLATYTGSPIKTDDEIGDNNLTEFGTLAYDATGLNVIC